MCTNVVNLQQPKHLHTCDNWKNLVYHRVCPEPSFNNCYVSNKGNFGAMEYFQLSRSERFHLTENIRHEMRIELRVKVSPVDTA